jgi:acyl carrier protein
LAAAVSGAAGAPWSLLMSREAFAAALTAFIEGPLLARHGRARPPMNVEASTPLFETGIIDSLGIIDLLLFVEAATGSPIPMRKVDMRFFGTVERITCAFWDTHQP